MEAFVSDEVLARVRDAIDDDCRNATVRGDDLRAVLDRLDNTSKNWDACIEEIVTLRARLEAAERERDAFRNERNALRDQFNRYIARSGGRDG